MSLSRNILKVISSKFAALVITLAILPVLTRLYSPGSFGILQVFASIVAIITVVSCLRYELSIPLAKNANQAAASFTLGTLFTLIFSFTLLGLVPLFKSKIARLYEMPELEIFLWLLPVFVLMNGLEMAMRNWAGYKKKFGAIAWSSFGSALGNRSLSLTWGLIIGASAAGLFAGALGKSALAFLLLFIFCGRALFSAIRNAHLNFGMLWNTAKLHKKFPIFNSWAVLFNTTSKQLPVFLLGFYFPENIIGYSVVGFLFLAKSIVSLPVRFISTSVAQVFFPTAAREYNETGSMDKIVSKVFKRLVQIGIFPLTVLIFLGPSLFGFVFGEEWTEAGVYAQILAPWFLLQFIGAPLGVYNILNRQGTDLILTIVGITGRMAGLLIGGAFFNPRIALGLFTVFSVITALINIALKLRLSGVSVLWGAKILFYYITVSCILILPVKFLSYTVSDLFIVLGTLLGTAVYAAILLKVDSSLRIFISDILHRL